VDYKQQAGLLDDAVAKMLTIARETVDALREVSRAELEQEIEFRARSIEGMLIMLRNDTAQLRHDWEEES
jgi:hypothetical protein